MAPCTCVCRTPRRSPGTGSVLTAGRVRVCHRFTVNLGFYSLTAATGTVDGDRFVNFAIAGFVDLPAHLLVYFILDRWVDNGGCRQIATERICRLQ